MTDYITDNIVQIDLNIDWDSRNDKTIIKSEIPTIGGYVSSYLWGSFNNFSLNINYITTSDALILNSWWETNTELTLYYETTSYNVLLRESPFKSLNRPYFDQYTGVLIFEKL